MAAIGKDEALPVQRTFAVDNFAVLKVLFWPNKAYGPQVAIMSAHGCWIADLSGPADQAPSKLLNDVALVKICSDCIKCLSLQTISLYCTVLQSI